MLNANPLRQATDSLRGYRYQILQSVDAWLDLVDDDIIYLEGVEDFDIVSDGVATLVQVKNTQHNITLRSKDVIDAINHYWESLTKHPDLIVKFRFITRSKIGKEQGNPFGNNQSGLRIWSRCSGDEETITKISEFLQNQEKISDDVKKFLKQEDHQKIFEQLIKPINWETGSPDASTIEQSISDKVLRHYNQKSIPIPQHETKKVVESLLKKAWTVATEEENRKLTQMHFLKILYEKANENVLNWYLQRLQKQEAQATALDTANVAFIGGSSDISIQSYSPILNSIPPLYRDVFIRTDLLTNIQTILGSEGIVIIQGGVDKGKTTLAKLSANVIDGDWFWVNFTNYEPSQVVQLLQRLVDVVSNRSLPVYVLLDNLNLQPQQFRQYKEVVGDTVYALLERGVKLLITSQHKPPNNLIRRLGVPLSVVIDVPNFTIPEIEQFARQLGCPAENAVTWAKLFQLPTRRHPRLIHTLLTLLREKDWMQQDVFASILQTHPRIEKELEEARELLTDLPEDQREFLYRLSLLTEFRKDYALNIGNIPKPIPYPGNIFSQLVGPWIDQISKTYYTISPLLTDAAEQVWSKSDMIILHAQVADAILEANDLTTIEARAVLRHSIRGKNKKGIIDVITSIMTAPEDNWENLYQEFSWLVHIKNDPYEELFPEDTFVNYSLRSLQYRIAVKVKPEIAPKILEAWDKETKPYEPRPSYLQSRLMLATQALRYNQVLLPAKKLIGYLKEMVDIRDSDQEIWENYLNCMGQLEEYNIKKLNFFSFLFSFVYARPPIYASFLSDLVDALDELQPEIRTLLLADFGENSIEAQLLVNGVWLAEAKLENPNWTRCLEVFDKVIEKTIAWGYPHIAAVSAKGQAIIHDEYLNDANTAHEVLQDIISKVEGFPVIEEAQAMVYFRQQCYQEALNIYERILPKWNPPSEQLNIGPLEEYRRAAICAANLDDWKKAGCFFEEGANKTQKIENTERYIGLYADAGFAYFKAGNMLDSVKLLNLALEKFETLPQNNSDLNYFTLKKRLNYAIKWIWVACFGSQNLSSEHVEPSAGFCSNQETNEEVLNLPDSPIEYTWLYLAQIEYDLEHGTTILEHALQVNNPETHTDINFFLSILKTQYDFRDKTFNELPKRIQQLANACELIKDSHQSGKGIGEEGIDFIPIEYIPDFTSVENITVMLVASLVVQLPTNVDVHRILGIWRTNSSELPITENIYFALDQIESILLWDHNQALTVMKTRNVDDVKLLTAAFRVIENKETNTENLFHAHIFISTSLIKNLTWIDPVVAGLAELLSAQWREKIKSGEMLQMNVNILHEIEQACNSSETGKKKVGQILLAAYQVVSTIVTPDTFQLLQSWAADP